MSIAVLKVPPQFPVGTSVSAYADHGQQPSGPPAVAALETHAVDSNSLLTFTTLSASTGYWAGAPISGVWLYFFFTTPPALPGGIGVADLGFDPATQAELDAAEAADALAFVPVLSTQPGTSGAPIDKVVWSFQPTDSAKGPMRLLVEDHVFAGTHDTVLSLGYNRDVNAGRVKAGEPTATFTIEQDYNDTTKRTIELYSEIGSADGSQIVRPFFFQVKRDATSPATFLTNAYVVGQPFNICSPTADPSTIVPNVEISQNFFTIYARADDLNRISVKAHAGRAAQIGLGTNGADDNFLFTSNASNANRAQINLNGREILTFYAAPNGAAGQAIAVGADDNTAAGLFAVGSSDTSVKALVARRRASQAANIFEVQDEGGTPLWSVDPAGLPKWNAAGNQQTTVGAAGGASAPPATPTKYLKVKDSAGTTLVIPAYAA